MTETWRAAFGTSTASEPPDDLELTVAGPAGGVSIVHVNGEVHAGNAVRLEEVLVETIHDGATMVVVDAGGLTFLDSTGLGVLVAINRQIASVGGRLGLTNVGRPLRRLLEISGVDRVLARVDEGGFDVDLA